MSPTDGSEPGTRPGAGPTGWSGGETIVEAGVGAGPLSEAALARLARGLGDPPLARPSFDDRAAVERWRRAVHDAWGEGTEPGEPGHQRHVVAGVPVLVAGPEDAAVTVVYAHGGGYVLGSAGVATPITARLARRLRVVSVDYRLAPEHRFPAALDDVCAVFAATCAAASTPVALAGDSAGGALVTGTALRAAGGRLPRPACLVLFCPHLDHLDASSQVTATPRPPVDVDVETFDSTEDIGGETGAAVLAAAYRGATPVHHPLLSPGRAPAAWLTGLPPTLVQTGTADPLWRQAMRFVRRARAAGAPVVGDVWDGLWHTWQYHRALPEADRAIEEATDFVLTVGPPATATDRPSHEERDRR